MPGSIGLVPQNTAVLPAKASVWFNQLVLESSPWGADYELTIHDGRSGFVFFNVEGHHTSMTPARSHQRTGGRLLLSKEFAAELGRPTDAGTIVGQLTVNANFDRSRLQRS